MTTIKENYFQGNFNRKCISGKWILKVSALKVCNGLYWFRMGQMAGSCEHGWELPNVVKAWNIFNDHPPASTWSQGQSATQLRSVPRLLSKECTYTCVCSHSKFGLCPPLRAQSRCFPCCSLWGTDFVPGSMSLNFYLSNTVRYLLTYSMEQSPSWEANQ